MIQKLWQGRVFTDEIAQSISIGEAQHAFVLNILKPDDITPIGDVINCQNKGWIGDDDVPRSDGTGVGLQDLPLHRLRSKWLTPGGWR